MRPRAVLLTAAAAALALGSAVALEPSVSVATAGDGLVDTPLADFASPTAIEWLPNDRLVLLEKESGNIMVGSPNGDFAVAATLNVCTESERGLLGLTVDPAFLGNGWIYVFYTARVNDGCINRVSRFTLHGEKIVEDSEVILLDNVPSAGGSHNGGDLDVDGEGLLLVSIGDSGRDPRGDSGEGGDNDAAQDLSLLTGKIVRITRDGRPAPGNPFAGPGTTPCALLGVSAPIGTRCQEIFASGLRNPYRIAVDRNDGTGRFFINDVGQNTFEEINEGSAGADYGWPEREEPCPQGVVPPCAAGSTTDPIFTYGRERGSFVTAGAFVPDGLWPPSFEGAYLFADGGSGNIWLRSAAGDVDMTDPIVTGAFGIVDMTFGFDTDGVPALYYVQVGGGLRVIRPVDVAVSTPARDLRIVPITPIRAYDTAGVSVAPGPIFNGTTRRIHLDPPAGTAGALVNLTYDATAGPGFVRTWSPRTQRPRSSALNAERTGTIAANAAFVNLDGDGSFVIESSTTARVIVDVLAWLEPTAGESADGRFEFASERRLIDSRLPAGSTLSSGSPNPYRRSPGQIDIDVLDAGGIPDGGTVAAVMVGIAAIGQPDRSGYVSAHAGGSGWPGTSNVNVTSGDVRSNMVLIPLGPDGVGSLTLVGVADVAVDLLGWVTSEDAPISQFGLITVSNPFRLTDTRTTEFGSCSRVTPASPCRVSLGGGGNPTTPGPYVPGGRFLNVTVTDTAAAGHVTVGSSSDVSTVNFTAPRQIRAAMTFQAFNVVSAPVSFSSTAGTHLVVDATASVSGS